MKLKRILPAVMTWLAVSVFAMSQALLAPLAALISADFGHGLGWSGLLFAAGCIPYIVVGPFAGRLLSAAGRHFSVSLALAVGAVSAVCLSYADRFWLVCLGLALLGTAAVFLMLPCLRWFCKAKITVSPGGRGRARRKNRLPK